jgi:hypothetical protein
VNVDVAKLDANDRPDLPHSFLPGEATADLYFSGTSCLFVLHGNVYDLVETGEATVRFYDRRSFRHAVVRRLGWCSIRSRPRLATARGRRRLRLQAMTRSLALPGEPAAWPNDPDRVVRA